MGKDFVLRAVKKIAAIGAGAVLLASTLTAATALDLGDFPEPFVTDGTYDTSTVLVVGENAKASDTAGMADIAVALQQASVIPVSGSSVSAVVEGGATIEKVGDSLNLGDWLGELQDTSLTVDDLPMLLADGTYEDNEGNNENEETFTQELELVNASSRLVFASDDDGDELTDVYLRLYDNALVYTYTLEFDTSIEYDNSSSGNAEDDFEGTELQIQGNAYTITDVELTSGVIDKITALAGDTVVTLEEGEEVQGITVSNVNEDENICIVTGPDGARYEIDEGTTEKVDGTLVGVIDVIAIHEAAQDKDICKIAVGATKVVLENDDEIEINGQDIDNSKLEFLETTPGQLEALNITYEIDDDMYLPAGDSWRDPVLGNFEITFASWSNPTETIELTSSGEDAELTFLNPDGKMVEIPFWLDTANDIIFLGEGDDDERLLTQGDAVDCIDDVGIDTNDDCKGIQLLVVDSGENAHIVEITSMDDPSKDSPKINFKDVTYGRTYEEDLTYNTSTSFDLGSVGSIALTLNDTGQIVVDTAQLDGVAETINEALLQEISYATAGTATVNISLTENDDELNQHYINLTMTIDTTDDEIDVDVLGFEAAVNGADYVAGGSTGLDESKENDDVKWYATEWGTIISRDADDPETWVKVEHPAVQASAKVAVAPTGSAVTTTATGGQVVFAPIQPDTKIAPSEITDVSNRNAILIGGPCANPLVDQVAGLTCDGMVADFTAGEAVVKLVAQGDKYALVVAGLNADDTRRAAKMLLNYKQYMADLDGKMEVIVKGTSVNTITQVA